MRVRPRGTDVRYTSRRRGDDDVRFDATYAPAGESYYPGPGSFEHWFLARERLFGRSFDGTTVGTDITVRPGPIRPARATVRENALLRAAAVLGSDDPPLHWRDRIEMTASTAEPVA